MIFQGQQQPRGWDGGRLTSNLANLVLLERMLEDVEELYEEYAAVWKPVKSALPRTDNGSVNRIAMQSLLIGGCIWDAFIIIRKYKNILFIPRHSDSQPAAAGPLVFEQEGYIPNMFSGAGMLPIIHFYNNSDGIVNIPVPKGPKFSFYDHAYESCAARSNRLNILSSTSEHVPCDGEWLRNVKGHPAEKYDAVVLMGGWDREHVPDKLKKPFARLGKPGFDLVMIDDFLERDERISADVSKLINTITPPSLKDEMVRSLGNDYSDRKRMLDSMSSELTYHRDVLVNSFMRQISNIHRKVHIV